MSHPPTLLSLPAELRAHIFSYLVSKPHITPFLHDIKPGGVYLDPHYAASNALSVLLTCRLIYHDFSTLLFDHTPFVIKDMCSPLSSRLSVLDPTQISSIRSIAWVINPVKLREMTLWRSRPFDFPIPDSDADLSNIEALELDVLHIVLYATVFWHYPADLTADLVALFRRLKGVKKIVFVRNRANVKGYFKMWYARLTGLMLRMDHQERYDKDPPVLEKVWWEWEFNDEEETFSLTAKEPKPVMAEEEYMALMASLVEELMSTISIRSRTFSVPSTLPTLG